MRTRDITPGGEYATCDGNLVVPEVPIRRGWIESVIKKGKTEHVFHEVTELDPWGGCMNARRPPTIGVLCTQYETDRDGKRIDDNSHQTVIEAKDIKGTWAEYLVLYGERVRNDADDRTADREDKQLTSDIAKMIGQLPFRRSHLSFEHHYRFMSGRRRKRVNERYLKFIDISLKLNPDELEELLIMLKKPIDGDVMKRLRKMFKTDAQFKSISEREEQAERKSA